MNYTLVTDASWCPETGIATGAAVWQDGDGKISKAKVWKLDATNNFDAELQALVLGINLIPKEANLTAFTDVQHFSNLYIKIKDGLKMKNKQIQLIKPLSRATRKRRERTEVLWAGEFGKDHQLLHIVHRAAYNKMKELRKKLN
jgi:ribonuclease HI